MTELPSKIAADRAGGHLLIGWPDASPKPLPFKFLRGECRCAACVDENTGIRILDLDSIPEDISIERLGYSGNYALKILWSDGHDTGLFTWDHLRSLHEGRPDAP